MSRKKPSWLDSNVPQLITLCEDEGYEYQELSKYHYRIMAATHIIDIWPSRMVYHRHAGEVIDAFEPWPRDGLDDRFNKEQVSKLLRTGEL
jgi:hypothetical protein